VLVSHVSVQELLSGEQFAADGTADGLGVTQVHEADVPPRIGRVRVHLAAHRAGDSVSQQILWNGQVQVRYKRGKKTINFSCNTVSHTTSKLKNSIQDPDPDPLVRGMDPDPSIIYQK
jgi:hypothetical protein